MRQDIANVLLSIKELRQGIEPYRRRGDIHEEELVDLSTRVNRVEKQLA